MNKNQKIAVRFCAMAERLHLVGMRALAADPGVTVQTPRGREEISQYTLETLERLIKQLYPGTGNDGKMYKRFIKRRRYEKLEAKRKEKARKAQIKDVMNKWLAYHRKITGQKITASDREMARRHAEYVLR